MVDLDLWNEVKIESVYRRLKAVAIIFLVPINISLFELIIMDNSKTFLYFFMKGPIPLQVVIISPLYLSLSIPVVTMPTVTLSTLLLTTIFLISLAGATIVGWYLSIVSFVRYTPGYNTFGDVKRGISRLLHGTGKDKGMLALFTAVLMSFYTAFALGFVVYFAYIFPDDLLIPVAIMCLIFATVSVLPSWNYVKAALNR